MANFFFENDGSGNFEEVGVVRGLAYNLEGRPLGNMGVDCADYDNDGWLDFFTTCFGRESPVLYRNLTGLYEDVTLATRTGAASIPHVNWGTGFADFDNDGDADLFIACGHIDQNVHLWSNSTTFRVRDILLMNSGDGMFVDISERCGDGLDSIESSRGIGLDDLDNDGDIDVVILNSRAPPTILRNDTRNDRHWLQIQLQGGRSNRDGVGAQARVTVGGRTQLAEVLSGRGYQSHHGTRLHFGLGACARVDRIEIRWIGGCTDFLQDVVADQLLQVTEGSSPKVEQARSTVQEMPRPAIFPR